MIDVTKQGVNIVVNSDDIDILIDWCDTYNIAHAKKQDLINAEMGYLWFRGRVKKINSLTYGGLDGHQSATVDEVIHNNNIKKLLTS